LKLELLSFYVISDLNERCGGLLTDLQAYEKASDYAIANSEIWLDVARDAINKKYYGHAYATAVFAVEEIVKAVVSFMVSREYLSADSRLLRDAYSDHIAKARITLGHIFNPLLRRSFKISRKDWRDYARTIVYFPDNKRVEKPQQLAKDLEFTRRLGVYVNVSEENGKYDVRSPSDFSKEMAETMIQSASVVIDTSKWMISIHDENPDGTKNWFEQVKSGFDYEVPGYPDK
jgi:AbiV family abortive infection protein